MWGHHKEPFSKEPTSMYRQSWRHAGIIHKSILIIGNCTQRMPSSIGHRCSSSVLSKAKISISNKLKDSNQTRCSHLWVSRPSAMDGFQELWRLYRGEVKGFTGIIVSSTSCPIGNYLQGSTSPWKPKIAPIESSEGITCKHNPTLSQSSTISHQFAE